VRTSLLNKENSAERMREDIAKMEAEIKRLTQLASSTSLALGAKMDEIDTEKKWIEANPEAPISEINQQIEAVHRHNQERIAFQQTLEKSEEMEKARLEADRLTTVIENIIQEKEKHISEKASIIPGLVIREEKVDADGRVIDVREGAYFEDKPIHVLSTTEAVRFSILVRKSMYGDSAMQVLFLDDFETYGSRARKEIAQLVEKEGWSALVAIMDPDQDTMKIQLTNKLVFDKKEKKKKAVAES
jgi:hypothetical protein